jgi:hypothetical protein
LRESDNLRSGLADNTELIGNLNEIDLRRNISMTLTRRYHIRSNMTYLACVGMFDARNQELELTLSIEGRHLGGGYCWCACQKTRQS